ncbi:hypothetical protein LIER_28879 [Lithospermum erythrorhizon]|uniref:LisH domain-containing protein n=1 Tax=Lithospermum erythrorhizon TaxID=34254 RepID=A0AAV3RJ40_LITER
MEPDPSETQPEAVVVGGDGGDEVEEEEENQEGDDEVEELIAKANSLMDKITANVNNPNPNLLHALASLLETQESRYKEENISSNNGRSNHNIGRLGSLLRENEEFFELISSTFLCESRLSEAVQAGAARLLFSCSLTFMYPHVFDDRVLENIKRWAIDETFRSFSSNHNSKLESGGKKCRDIEMLRTYSTGLLAVCLAGGGQVVEDVLTSGLAANLMRYLRSRVLGEAPSNQKDTSSLTEAKTATLNASSRSRDESRVRLRQLSESSHLEAPRLTNDGPIDDLVAERDISIIRQAHADGRWDDEDFPDSLVDLDPLEVEIDGAERRHVRDICDAKGKSVWKSPRLEEIDEPSREDSARRRVNRGLGKSRGKSRVADGVMENEQTTSSPSSGIRLGGHARAIKEMGAVKNQDSVNMYDEKKTSFKTGTNDISLEREDNDDCFQDCKIGSRDITDFVIKAVRAAEAEARTANAPAEAIKAAGDAAAELVKSAALEEYRNTNDEDASVLAASNSALTVIDAANAVEVLRNSAGGDGDPNASRLAEPETSMDYEEFFILDSDSLSKLREKFCIQCLIILGEYVEVLGPVLHEKGVDVCLALLQRSSKLKDAAKVSLILPDVLKLINALAAHRKFAAVFVDRSGIQKLLAATRAAETFLGLSSCLFTIGSIQGIMERVCALPSSIVQQVVELALELLACPQDQARKNAALFFGAAFVFRAILDAFDSRDGLQKMLSLLHDAASVRSGGSSGSLPGSGSRNDRSPAEVLTSSEKQIAYHTCVALRQYFRAHLILLVDSVRPYKGTRSATWNIPNSRAAYKPLDISNEAVDAIFRQIQKERKLGPSLVRARWSVVDKFLSSNGHVTMLELCQAPPVERYLHDLLQYALGVLHIVTLVPYSRKLVVNATVSNDRVGIAIILDAASGAGCVEPEIIQEALNVLVNLVCPPPSISNKPAAVTQGQQTVSSILLENRDRNTERGAAERVTSLTTQNESRERNGDPASVDRSSSAATSSALPNTSQASSSVSAVGSGLVGDRRISLGAGAGCAGLAAQLEQGYHQAREAVRANNGIKVLLQLLQPRIVTPPGSLDCLRALACRVLLGLARDDTIAHILTKLQVGKKLSELIRDSGSTSGNEQNRWQTELVQVAIELIGVVTNSGRANALAATDAATPALRRIERAAIAAATPILYHSRELLLLIHEHLQASGMVESAAALLKEGQLTPLLSLAAPSSLAHQAYVQETFPVPTQWPSGRIPLGFMSDKIKTATRYGGYRCDSAGSQSKKKVLSLPFPRGSHMKTQPPAEDSKVSCSSRSSMDVKRSAAVGLTPESPSVSTIKTCGNLDTQTRTPVVLPMKRKLTEPKDTGLVSSVKRINTGKQLMHSPVCATPVTVCGSGLSADQNLFFTPGISKEQQGRILQSGVPAADADDANYLSTQLGHMMPSAQHALPSDSQASITERLTLDSIVVQYLKQQHRQCSAPITTLPPLSLLHPHVCPEPHRSLDAPPNVTSRLSTREFKNKYGGLYGSRKDRQFVYSRFRPWRTCRDDAGALLTCISFIGDSSQIAVGSHTGELKIFDSNGNGVVENYTGHQSPVTLLQSCFSGDTQLILSSTSHDVRLWDSVSISAGPRHSFDGCKTARFSNSGTLFAALSSELSQREVHLYDIQTCQLDVKLADSVSGTSNRGHMHSHVHFNPSDTMLLWDGVLWDRRVSGPIHHFDQFTDFGGGGFHPAGNEVIINSEVWDLRNFHLLRSVPSLDQTLITFNASGNVIYAILRRNLDDVMSAFQTRRVKHPLFAAFRTVDAVTYSDIATIPVDRCVLDFATEPTDSFVGLVTMDDQDEMYSSARMYEIGRRKPTDDDSDPDDAETDNDEEDEEEDDMDDDPIVEADFEGDSDADDVSNDDSFSDLDDDDDDDDDGDFMMDNDGFNGGGIFEFGEDDDDGDDSEVLSFSSGDEEDIM